MAKSQIKKLYAGLFFLLGLFFGANQAFAQAEAQLNTPEWQAKTQTEENHKASTQLMLVGTYTNQDLTGWVMSEKLDGVRGFWDGKQLFTRQHRKLTPPHYFVKDFPPFAIDGELFTARDEFAEISSIVRSQKDKGWEKMKLYVFDVPNAQGDLFARLQVLRDYLTAHPSQHIEIIPQIPIKSRAQMQEFFNEVLAKKGEGIIVRNPTANYEHKRSNQILKIKPVHDEECTVIAHNPGRGKFEGLMGSVTCKNQRGEFRIGSGFNLAERENPPAIGSLITYKYRGLTKAGLPRFATYWRERTDK